MKLRVLLAIILLFGCIIFSIYLLAVRETYKLLKNLGKQQRKNIPLEIVHPSIHELRVKNNIFVNRERRNTESQNKFGIGSSYMRKKVRKNPYQNY